MLGYIQQTMVLVDNVQEFCRDLRKERLARIQSGEIPGQVERFELGHSFMTNFGDMFQYHKYESKDNATYRAYLQSLWRGRAAESVYACRALMARLLSQTLRQETSIEDIRFPDEEDIIDLAVERADRLVFGEDHILLPSEEEYLAKYPEKNHPQTHGRWVEITLYTEHTKENNGLSALSFVSAGRWKQREGSDLLYRDKFFSSFKGDIDDSGEE
jgi:hypothetical protein